MAKNDSKKSIQRAAKKGIQTVTLTEYRVQTNQTRWRVMWRVLNQMEGDDEGVKPDGGRC